MRHGGIITKLAAGVAVLVLGACADYEALDDGGEGTSDTGQPDSISSPDSIPNQYVVVLDEQGSRADSVQKAAQALLSNFGPDARIIRIYESALSGFLVEMPEEAAIVLAQLPGVAFVEDAGSPNLLLYSSSLVGDDEDGDPALGRSAAPVAAASSDCFLLNPLEPHLNDYGNIQGSGYVSCSTPTTLQVTLRIREDRTWWPDRTLASTTITSTKTLHAVTATYVCAGGPGTLKVFSELIVSGYPSKQSPRVTLACN